MSETLFRLYQACKSYERAGKPIPPKMVAWIARTLGVWDEMVSLGRTLEAQGYTQ